MANLAFNAVGDHLPGAACVGALVDRFTQHCLVMDIDRMEFRYETRDLSDRGTLVWGYTGTRQ